MSFYLKAHFMTNETAFLAHGFDSILMKYLPELFCSEVKPDSIYSKMGYISLLVKASTLNSYMEGTSNVSRKLLNVRRGTRGLPTGETALSYFKTIDRFELQSVVGIVIEDQLNELKNIGLLDLPVPIAFDWNDKMFYGDYGNAEMVNGTKPRNGSCYAYQYMTASILVDSRRLTVALIPIKSREHLLSYVEYALAAIRNMGIKVKYLLFDGGFSSTSLPIYLQKHGYRYILHFTPNAVTKRMNLEDGESALYSVDGDHKEQQPFFKIIRADDSETNIKYLFATNMRCKSKRVLKRYKQRWGVETSYRKHNEFLARTTSKNYVVRLLYYSVAVCIYNCWCLLNAQQGQEREDEDDEHVIALEVKLILLFEFFFSLMQT